MVVHPATVPVPARVPAPQPGPHAVQVLGDGGVRLAGERYDASPSARPGRVAPVVFAHGFGQTRQAWTASARRIAAAGYPAWSFDARGHGRSDWNPPLLGYALDQFVGDARAVAVAMSSPPVWVGASMGGLLGLLAEGEAPATGGFAALVLVDITPRWESAGVERILGFMRAHPHGFDSLEQAADAIAGYLPHRRRKSPAQLASLLVDDGAGRLRWHWDPRLLVEMAEQSERWQGRLVAAARRLSVPTLLISGGASDLVSQTTADEFLGLVPQAAHVRIDGATHMVAGDRNDVFTDTILDFLAAHAAVPDLHAAHAASNGAAR